MSTRPGIPWRRAVALVALLLAATGPAGAAVGLDDLLPVDEAFVLRAEATAPGRIEIAWTIADGYYLYRHRMGAEPLDAGFRPDAAGFQLPPGKAHVDEFFGEVETYRGHVAGTLAGEATAGSTRLKIRYQGCADLGICYPPQTRTVEVRLPPGGPGAGAAAGADAGFAALGQALGGGSAGAPSRPGAGAALPLPEEQAFAFEAIAGDGNTILMRFTPAPGYYLYRDRSSFALAADGIAAAAPRWPPGVEHNDGYFGDVVVYFDQVDVPLPLVRSHGEPREAVLTATFQGCQDEGICYPPMTRSVQVALPQGVVTASAEDPLPAAEAALPPPGEAADGSAPAPSSTPPANGAPPPAGDAPDASVPVADASADNAVRSRAPALPTGGLLGARALCLLGGLLLNLMPCVLPILSLKVVGLAQSGESRAAARSHAIWYTLGVLSAFAAIGALVLGLRAAGLALGWGFQLQQPWFVALLVYLMFAVGLSLSGVFSVGGSVGAAGQRLASRDGRMGDFFTGVLACVVASPCIAPFMGGALAFAFTASAPLAMSVFLALGLGLALPFLLIGFVPALASRLPRPGPWMETLKQFMAFPMYLTAVWLAWVLGRQHGVDAMALVGVGLVLLGLGLWWYERKRWTGSKAGRALALAVLVAALLPVAAVARLEPGAGQAQPAGADAIAWSPERLAALRA
ncbi:MAG: cytochrome C biogenesis protein, partial [Gammaproteobacteria bacterium]|nr:cytochrome C biogenesis protein [Gammaproteobacteria bacterium]